MAEPAIGKLMAFAIWVTEQCGKQCHLKVEQYLYEASHWVSQWQAKKQQACNTILYQA